MQEFKNATYGNIKFDISGPYGESIDNLGSVIVIVLGVLALEGLFHEIFHIKSFKLFVVIISLICAMIHSQTRKEILKILEINYLPGPTPLIPVVLLKVTSQLDVFLFKKCFFQILMLGSVGMVMFGLIVGYNTYFFENTPRSAMWIHVLVYGISFSGIDDVEISKSFMEYDAIRDAFVIVIGEYIITTAFGLLAVPITIGLVDGAVSQSYQILCICIRYIVFGLLIGFILGWSFYFLMSYVKHDITFITCISILFVYGTFFVCEYILFCSGVIATFIVCVYTIRVTKELSPDIVEFLDIFYDILYSVFTCSKLIFAIFYEIDNFSNSANAKNFVKYVATYFTCVFSRMLVLSILYPVLKYSGRKFKFNSVMVIFWLAKKGLVQIILIDVLLTEDEIKSNVGTLNGNVIFTIVLGLMFNSIFSKKLLKSFGLTASLVNKQSNKTKCIKLLNDMKNRATFCIKANRLFADVNWKRIMQATDLSNPHQSRVELELMRYLPSYCDECQHEVMIKPIGKEYIEFIRECKVKLLKAQNVTILRLLNKNLITESTAKILLRGLNNANNSTDLTFRTDYLEKVFNQVTLMDRLLDLLVHIGQVETSTKPPRKWFRRICYNVIKFIGYDVFMYFIILSYTVLYYIRLFYFMQYADVFSEAIYTLIFAIDCFLKIMACSHIYIKQGIILYIRDLWNRFDLLILMNNVFITIYAGLINAMIIDPFDDISFVIFCAFKQICMLRLLKSIVILYHLREWFVKWLYTSISKRVSHTYDVANALLMCHDDVIHMLPTMEISPGVFDFLMEFLEGERARIQEEICQLYLTLPGVIRTHHTKMVCYGTIKFLKASLVRLQLYGMVDKTEGIELMDDCNAKYMHATKILFNKSFTVSEAFKSIHWLQDTGIYDMAIKAARGVSWNESDIVILPGQTIREVIILTEGMLVSVFKPTNENMEQLTNFGIIPIADYHDYYDHTGEASTCIIPGGNVGLLGFLTGRKNDAIVRAKVKSKGFVIPEAVFLENLNKHSDPIDGFYSILWKSVAFDTAHCLLWETKFYRSKTRQEIFTYLHRSFVPYLCNRRTFIVKEFVKDVILIEGLIEDMLSKTVYYGPICIPRGVNYLRLMRDKPLVEPKLWIVPTRNAVLQNILSYDDFEAFRITNRTA